MNILCSNKSGEHVSEITFDNELYTIHYGNVIPTVTCLENAAVKLDSDIGQEGREKQPYSKSVSPNDKEKKSKYHGCMYDMKTK